MILEPFNTHEVNSPNKIISLKLLSIYNIYFRLSFGLVNLIDTYSGLRRGWVIFIIPNLR